MAKMEKGECRCTKKGVQYCYVPDVGVRIKGKCPTPEQPTPAPTPAPEGES